MPKINPKFDSHRADTLNPNNDAFWQSRGYEERPDNWEQLLNEGEEYETKIHHSRHKFPSDGGYSWPLCKDDY